MKNILCIILTILSLSVFGQVQDTALLAGKAQFSQSGAGSGYWQVSGTFSDESGLNDAGGIQVGDVLFFSDAGIGYFLPITEVVSATPPSFVIRVNNTGITNIISVPTTSGVIYRPSTGEYLTFTSGISNPDQQTFQSRLAKKLDELSSADGNGIISALPLGNVVIASSNSLTFKNGATGNHFTYLKTNAGVTGTRLYPGGINTYKTTAGSSFGGTLSVIDTTGVIDNAFAFTEDDRGGIQAAGAGPQLVTLIENVKAAGTYRWAYGLRTDTSDAALSVMRIMHGDRYASTIVPVYHHFVAAVKPSETTSNAAFTFTDNSGGAGKLSMSLNGSLLIRRSGKVYIGADSSFVHNPVVDTTLFKGKVAVQNSANYYYFPITAPSAAANVVNIQKWTAGVPSFGPITNDYEVTITGGNTDSKLYIRSDVTGVTASYASNTLTITIPGNGKIHSADWRMVAADVQASADAGGVTNWTAVRFVNTSHNTSIADMRCPDVTKVAIPSSGSLSASNSATYDTDNNPAVSVIDVGGNAITVRVGGLTPGSQGFVLKFTQI